MTDEPTLLAEIKVLKEAKDYVGLKTKMEELIALQEDVVIPGFTDAQLAQAGVDLLLLAEERELAQNIKQAEQDGDFVAANQFRRDLVIVQRNQSKIRELI